MELRSNKPLQMNEWHNVMIKRRGDRAELSVNRRSSKAKRSTGGNVVLDVDNGVYVGGLDKTTAR